MKKTDVSFESHGKTHYVSGCGVFDPLSPSGCYCAECERGEGCEIDKKQVELCREWIRKYTKPRKTINRKTSSYGLKHRVERWCKEQKSYAYIGNGAFVAAALLEGYRAEAPSINVFFDMHFKKS